jgi:soluble lytic murein transglycosylase
LAGRYALLGLRRPQLALTHFERLHDNVSSPISKARGAYWAAQAATNPRDDTLARRWLETAQRYDTAFYGQLASHELGTPSPLVTSAPSPAEHKDDAFFGSDLAKAAVLLDRLGFDRMVKTFVLRMAEQAGSERDLRLVGELSRRLGRLDLALRTAKIARSHGHILYGDLFPELPLAHGGDPEEALVLAVIRQESAFDHRAVSHAGARGLMQLMPATAKRVAGWEGVRYVRHWLTEEPDYNVRLGRAYLRKMIERYEGAYPLALAAYNAGPHRVDRWLKTYGDPRTSEVSTVEWIENIPFGETRNYVQRVLEGLIVYRARRSAQLTWSMEPPDDPS